MDKEPLLPTNTPRTPSQLCSLPEDDEISIPLPLTPSELKDMLIFGSPKEPSSSIVDALALSLNTQKPFACDLNLNLNSNSNSISNSIISDPQQAPSPQSWLTDPNYSFGKTNLHRSKTAPAMAAINDFEHHSESKPPSSTIVRQAVLLLILYLSLGVLIYWYNQEHFVASETHVVVDALYFCIVTMCTIGYGDITPNSVVTKLFSIMFVLIGFGFIDILLSGMVSYVLDLQENHLLQSLKAGHEQDHHHPSYIIDVKKGRMRIRMKVALALGVVILCIGIGVAVMHFVERLDWVDSFYLSVMSVTTVGYGDRAFRSMGGRLFASVWLLVSTLAVARAFLYLAEARIDKRHRKMAKLVLDQGLTVSQFLAADIDNNGYVRF
ncbi:two-pore potassium channel 3-like isoform X2 [Cynara cardunculus var. scolymus]|nr:two-pore potassium channel 3-like isoform X2 [Cynara cardunculus var. scolymus]